MACMDVISKTGPFFPQGNRFGFALPLLPREQNLGSSPPRMWGRGGSAQPRQRGDSRDRDQVFYNAFALRSPLSDRFAATSPPH